MLSGAQGGLSAVHCFVFLSGLHSTDPATEDTSLERVRLTVQEDKSPSETLRFRVQQNRTGCSPLDDDLLVRAGDPDADLIAWPKARDPHRCQLPVVLSLLAAIIAGALFGFSLSGPVPLEGHACHLRVSRVE